MERVLVSGSLRCCVRWTELAAVVLLLVCVRVVVGLAGLGGGWCVLVRVLTELVVCGVRLARGIVVVAVRLCEAFWRPFWVGVVSWCGVGV